MSAIKKEIDLDYIESKFKTGLNYLECLPTLKTENNSFQNCTNFKLCLFNISKTV